MDPHCAEFIRIVQSMGWSKAHAARQLGLDSSVVTRYYQGATKPSLTVLRLLAGLTGDRLLLPGESEQPSAFDGGPRYLDTWESDLIRLFRRIEPHRRARVINAIREIVDSIGAFPKRPMPLKSDPVQPPKPPDKVAELMAEMEADHANMIRAARKNRRGEASKPGVPDPQ